MTQFSPWYALDAAATAAPAAPGVFQVKLAQLVDYPTGKSAMIHYGAADDVRAALVALAAAHPGAPWLARHDVLDGRATTPSAALADLLTQFRRRFGREPSLPVTP